MTITTRPLGPSVCEAPLYVAFVLSAATECFLASGRDPTTHLEAAVLPY
jgi:hypothetical protein